MHHVESLIAPHNVNHQIRIQFVLAAAPLFAALLLTTVLFAQSEHVVHSFPPPNADHPTTSILTIDKQGHLYGVAESPDDNGMVFELTLVRNRWTEKRIYTFAGGNDGTSPRGGMVLDSAGNLYGVTFGGGQQGCGTVFELTPNEKGPWAESVIYSFACGTDGANPRAALILDKLGNLYGTTSAGGDESCPGGCGTVFQLSPYGEGNWAETVLHRFAGGEDGYMPFGGVVLDWSGHLYGTAALGGKYGRGIVFRLTPGRRGEWRETVLHHFKGGNDGALPAAGLALFAGTLYGTTYSGGSPACGLIDGCGSVFQLTRGSEGQWQEKVILAFSGSDGIESFATPVLDQAGNIYGTTFEGGGGPCTVCGTAFELTPVQGKWTETVLHDFGATLTDAGTPEAGVILDSRGHLFGTSSLGGSNGNGTVYEITP